MCRRLFPRRQKGSRLLQEPSFKLASLRHTGRQGYKHTMHCLLGGPSSDPSSPPPAPVRPRSRYTSRCGHATPHLTETGSSKMEDFCNRDYRTVARPNRKKNKGGRQGNGVGSSRSNREREREKGEKRRTPQNERVRRSASKRRKKDEGRKGRRGARSGGRQAREAHSRVNRRVRQAAGVESSNGLQNDKMNMRHCITAF